MKKQQFGRIVILSYVSVKRGSGAHYSGLVLGFSKNLAREVATDRITVNCVAPGLVNTDIWKALPEEDAKKVMDGIPAGRPGETEGIASIIAFLISDEASYITGEDIDINGGSHIYKFLPQAYSTVCLCFVMKERKKLSVLLMKIEEYIIRYIYKVDKFTDQ